MVYLHLDFILKPALRDHGLGKAESPAVAYSDKGCFHDYNVITSATGVKPPSGAPNVAITGGGTPYRAWAGWHSLSSMRQLDGCQAVQADPGLCRFNREFAMNVRGNSDHELSTESPVGECLRNGFF